MKNKRSKSLLLLLALALLVAAALPISAFAASGDKGSHAGLVPAAGIQVDITEPDSVATTTYPESMETITITPGTRGNTKLTITVTNTGAEEKVLSFHYSYTGATYESFTVDGEPVSSTDATISKTVASKGVVELYLHTNKVTDTTLTLSDFALLDNVGAQASVAITGKGTVSVDGAGVANGESAPIDANSQFVATPASGYTFMGWVDANNKILSHDATYKPGWTADSSIHAIFADSSIPCFRVGKEYLYADLDSALTMATSGKASSKVVVVANSATLTGSHSIPSGVTLLVPFDTMEEPMGEIPDFVEQETGKPETKWAKPTAYRTLTLAEGASITVDNGGKLEVSGKMHSVQGYCGSPTGPVGFINMGEDSSITVKSGGALYAWGFITGHDTATVTIKSGGKVYENFQIIDWRGGSASLAMIIQDKTTFNLAKEHDIGGRKVGLFPTQVMNNGVFPMSQYFVQNIEVKLVLEYGAYEYGATVIDIGLTGPKGLSVPYIGANVAGFEGMFRMTGTSSKITKRYDGATDRLIVDIEGGLNLDRMFLHIANYDIWLVFSTKTISIDLDSQYFALPINSNMTVNIKSGANVTAQQDLSLLPGAELNIDGTMTMASGKTLYVYDSAEWVGKGFVFVNHDLRVVPYAPTKSFDRATATLNDAKVIVNGTLDASSGYLYTSASGANICSTGNGIVKINTSNKATTTKNEGVQTNTTMSYSQVSMTSAVLQNKSGTQSTSGGGTFNYGHDKWFKGTHTLTTTETQAPTGAVPGVATITCACGNYTATEPIATIAHKDDNDGDHLCDFGCGTTVTTCADAGKDHICDSDSECTVYNSGSNAHVSDTANNTHNCVYCGKAASECADDENDGDHKCDVCGEKASTCGDEDKDHQCDTDSACTAYSRDTHHFDRNHDHVCDNGCTESIGECTDSATDKDHVCDYGCGLVLEDCSDVTGDGNHSCDICSAADITDHDWVDATCEDPLTCSECGATEGTAPGHAWDDATCTAPKTCSECSATEGTALGHDWDNDCDTDCNRNCGATRVITHNWDGGEVTTDPTCTSLGEKTYTCGVCGEKEYVAVEKAEHEWVDATCAEPKHCENCPATEGETLPHTQWDGGEVTTDPTCTTLGEKTYTCVCGETKTEEVAMIDHEYDDATCTDPETCYCGATTGDALGHDWDNDCDTDCNRNCGETREVTHNWDDGEVTTDPTCTSLGEKTYTCGVCGEKEYVNVEMAEHEWVDATCAEPKHCENCPATEGETLPHTQWDEGVVTTDPTCTTLGEKTYTCVCGETKTEEVAMIAHEYDDATCTDPETCYCGATTGDPLGHSFTNYVSNNDATCVDNGTETAYCEHNCGTTDTRAAAEGAQGHDWTEATCSAPKTCGVCGETEGEALAHTAGTAVKENKKIQQTTTGTTGSCDSVVYCTACGEEMSRTTQQSLKLTETPFLGMSMSLKDSLALCVAVNVKNMNANYTATITRDYIDENGDPASDTYTVTADDWQWVDQSKGQAMIVYRGMAAKEMCDDITISIYDDNGKLVAAYSDSGRNYGMRMVNKYAKSGTAYPEEAAMFVDMLNYGAAAQQQFHYRENELANALVSPEQQAFATDDIASKDVVNAQSKGVGYSGSSLELENYIGLKFAIQKSKVSTVASAEISYISHNGRAYSKIISVVDFESDKSGKYYVFTAPGLAIADGQTVVTLVLKDGAGNVISTSTDSMESYAGRMKPTGNEWDIYQMILKFSRSAYAYFH